MPRERAASEVKEPHSISLKVLRLSRPSLAEQHSLPIDRLSVETPELEAISKASHAYPSHALDNPFILSPLLTLPPAFGSAYIGECFSCCLSANNEAPSTITSVRISAEMQTPSQTLTLELGGDERDMVDLETKESTQKIVRYDLKEEGNHILAVTVTYTEAPRKEKEPKTEEAEGKGEGGGERGPPTGRVRTFRKLYQFIAQQCLTVRTKTGPLPNGKAILEAQLENMGEGPISLEMVNLGTRKGWKATSLNWPGSSSTKATRDEVGGNSKTIPLLRSREIMQVAFLLQPIEEKPEEEPPSTTSTPPPPPPSSSITATTTTTPPSTEKVVLGQLSIEWRSACGDRGFLSTGRLGLHV